MVLRDESHAELRLLLKWWLITGAQVETYERDFGDTTGPLCHHLRPKASPQHLSTSQPYVTLFLNILHFMVLEGQFCPKTVQNT